MVQPASQICQTARNIAKCPGYTVQSGNALNEVLADITETQNFDFARGFFQFQFNPGITGPAGTTPGAPGTGPYVLPTDWLRADFRDVFFTDQGVPHPLTSVESYQWDMQVQQSGLQSYPTLYTTYLEGVPAASGQPPSGPPVMFVWSPPQSNYTVTCRYRRKMPSIPSAENSSAMPWFPYTRYLVLAVARSLMRITDDTRYDDYEAKCEKEMSKLLKLANDNQGRGKTVKLEIGRAHV